jgi:MFS family permease
MAFCLVTLCCFFASLGSFLFGYDSGVISSTLVQTDFQNRFNSPSDAATGGIVASYNGKLACTRSDPRNLLTGAPGGAIIGSVIVSYISDPWGRRTAIFIGGILATLGAALQAGATTVAMLIAGRVIAGMAVGLMSSVIPVYCVCFHSSFVLALFVRLSFRRVRFLRPGYAASWVPCNNG